MTEPGADSEELPEINARRRCFECDPIQDGKYFLLFGCANGEISYYSKGIAWSDDGEVRVARLVKAKEAVQHYRGKGIPLAIINSREDFDAWMRYWCCHALIERSIWQALNYLD